MAILKFRVTLDDCRTFEENVPLQRCFVAKLSTFVLLFAMQRLRCMPPLNY